MGGSEGSAEADEGGEADDGAGQERAGKRCVVFGDVGEVEIW